MKKISLFKLLTISIVLVLTTGMFIGCNRAQPAGEEYGSIDASSDPVQTEPDSKTPIIMRLGNDSVTLTLQARYRISALLVSKNRYSSGWQAMLSQFDLALVWGKLIEPEAKKYITYDQRNRWYYYHYKAGTPYTNAYIIEHSSNNHIIPATDNLKEAVKLVRVGDLISLEGYLVNVDGSYNGEKIWWHTSKTRKDTANGSCEVFYIKKLLLKNKIYE
jgi:hypothetical protein